MGRRVARVLRVILLLLGMLLLLWLPLSLRWMVFVSYGGYPLSGFGTSCWAGTINVSVVHGGPEIDLPVLAGVSRPAALRPPGTRLFTLSSVLLPRIAHVSDPGRSYSTVNAPLW